VQALVERSKHHREDGAEGAVKRTSKGVRMLFDSSGYPRVSKLQQQRAAGSKENRALPIDLPGE
jgi:hypothetical protein